MGKRLVDLPVTRVDDESLGIARYAKILEKFIVNCDTPITVGIQGDWGIGKTSLLNMLIEQLSPRQRRQSKYHIIYFNTWQYSQFNQDEMLGLSILKGIMSQIEQLDVCKDLEAKKEFDDKLKTFRKFVYGLGTQILKSKTGMDIKEAYDASVGEEGKDILSEDITVFLQKLKGEFEGLVRSIINVNNNDKLVIIIDDLDRIRPVKALEFLEAIKNFLDVEYCVFVMAVDYSIVQQGMLEKLGRTAQEMQGKSYFDKIIQVPFNMPVSSYETDRYIMSLLGWDYNDSDNKYVQQKRAEFFLKISDQSISKDDIEFFVNITALTVGKNPRSIKRAINYANLLRMIVQDKRAGSNERWKISDAKILYSLSCMQLAWPELFGNFALNPSAKTLHLYEDFNKLSGIYGMRAILKRSHDEQVVKSNISGFIGELITLVDSDGNGEIDQQEFMPIWKMLQDANLTYVAMRNIDEQWAEYKNLVIENMGASGDLSLVDNVVYLFRNSKWNDALLFDLLSAGKKFYNIIWSRNQVGSLVSTRGQPIQMYLKKTYDEMIKISDGILVDFVADVSNEGHYGAGDLKINLEEISKMPKANAIEIMDKLLAGVAGPKNA